MMTYSGVSNIQPKRSVVESATIVITLIANKMQEVSYTLSREKMWKQLDSFLIDKPPNNSVHMMNKELVNKIVIADLVFHGVLIMLIVAHPDYFKKELVGVDLVMHLIVLALLFRVA